MDQLYDDADPGHAAETDPVDELADPDDSFNNDAIRE